MSSTSLTSLHEFFANSTPEQGGKYVRIKYTPDHRLLSVERSTRPVFTYQSSLDQARRDDTEPSASIDLAGLSPKEAAAAVEDNRRRAVNRAKVRVFDLILCNPHLDAFVTLTVDAGKADRTDYAAIYKYTRAWLSNRVQRRKLAYVLCPEYHKDGEAIHYHMIANSAALALEPARTPTGRTRQRKGKPVFNLPDWELGFSTAQIIPATDNREAVAKYMFKYMGKQAGQMIGGRYFLSGGDLARPRIYLEDTIPPELDCIPPRYVTEMQLPTGDYHKRYYL